MGSTGLMGQSGLQGPMGPNGSEGLQGKNYTYIVFGPYAGMYCILSVVSLETITLITLM